MPKIRIQLSPDGGGSWLAVGAPIAGDDALEYDGGTATIKARLESLARVNTVAWDVVSTSDGASIPTVTVATDQSATFSVPLATPAAYLLRCRINGGLNADDVSTTVIKSLTATGYELIAAGEETEADATYGWSKAFNNVARGGPGGGGSFASITLTSPSTSFTTTANFVGYDGVYFTAPGSNEIGFNLNGTLVPPSWDSVGGTSWVLYIAQAPGTGRKIDFYAQPSTDGIGGSIRLFSGDGATESGGVKWGRQTIYGDVFTSGRLDRLGIGFNIDEDTTETARINSGIGIGPLSFTKFQASATQSMEFGLESDTADGDLAFEAFYRFAYQTNASLRIPLIIGYESVRVSGTITQVQPEAFSPSEMDVTSECAPSVSTSSTTPTLLTSLAVPTNRCVTVTVSCQHDNGTTTGRTVYSAVFRRGAGSASTETAAVDITPSSAMKKSHAVTIALNSNTIEIKVVAASATATKHRAQVAWEVGTIS